MENSSIQNLAFSTLYGLLKMDRQIVHIDLDSFFVSYEKNI